MEDKNIFSKVEEKTNVKKEDIIKLAKKASSQDLSDEKNIRKLIKEVAKLAGKDVSKEKEDKIINAVVNDKVPKDVSGMF